MQDHGPVKVGRRWLPWRSRTRSATAEAYDWLPLWGKPTGDDPISVTLGLIGFIICLPLLIPAFLMTPIFLAESLLQWLVLPFAVLLRMLGVLPVEVDARRGDGAVYRERVNGWARAKERKRQLKHGVPGWHRHA